MADENLERITILLQAKDRDFQRAIDRNNKLLARATREMERNMTRQARTIDTNIKAMSSQLLGLGKSFALGLAGGVVGAAFAAVTSNVRGLVAEMANIPKAAERVGLPVEEFQALSFSFGQAGVEAAAFTQAMEQFTKRVGDAAQGEGELARVLAARGIALRGSDGQLRSTIDLLRDYAGTIAAAGTAQERLLLTDAAFGGRGKSLVNALAGGAEGINAMIAAAREAGVVLDERILRKAEEIDDRFDRLTKQIGVWFKKRVVEGIEAAGAALEALQPNVEAFGGYSNLATALEDLVPKMEAVAAATSNAAIGKAFADAALDLESLLRALEGGAITADQFRTKVLLAAADAVTLTASLKDVDATTLDRVKAGISSLVGLLQQATSAAASAVAELDGAQIARAAARDRMLGFEPGPGPARPQAPGASPRPRGAPPLLGEPLPP
ncbi:MAG: hypothetical protein ACK4OP_01155, partial [Gemmobacter sp.]